MWIRSQSKETLLKATKIFIHDNQVFASMEDGFDEMVGEYKSKERAIEILDSLQYYIEKYEIDKTRNNLNFSEVVCQMPEG